MTSGDPKPTAQSTTCLPPKEPHSSVADTPLVLKYPVHIHQAMAQAWRSPDQPFQQLSLQ
jgi:hypothetical protein